jgi:hypothetical protein
VSRRRELSATSPLVSTCHKLEDARVSCSSRPIGSDSCPQRFPPLSKACARSGRISRRPRKQARTLPGSSRSRALKIQLGGRWVGRGTAGRVRRSLGSEKLAPPRSVSGLRVGCSSCATRRLAHECRRSWNRILGRPSHTSIQGQACPLDGPTEAAELPADRLLRGPHRGLGPALRGRKTTTLVDELPKGGDSLLKPCVGHVGDRDGLPAEYAGWVRIVGT